MKAKKLERLVKGLSEPAHPNFPSSVFLRGSDGSGTGKLGASGSVGLRVLRGISARAELARREVKKLAKGGASPTTMRRAQEEAASLSKQSTLAKMVAQENARADGRLPKASPWGPGTTEIFDLSKLHTLPPDESIKGF